jgi:NTE family protein
MSDFLHRTALVLSGGGARGAYEAGVMAGLVDVLEHVHFDLFAGTSVGAINATYLASHAHLPDLGVGDLLHLWTDLSPRTHLRPERHPLRRRAFLDVRPFEDVVQQGVAWDHLARNLDSGRIEGLFVAALDVETGRTAVFADLAPNANFRPSHDPRRMALRERIGPDHVLASAAIPGVFPPRAVGDSVYYDGGLRFNTPMAPVLRAGAKRLVVVSPLHAASAGEPTISPDQLDPFFLAGKMLHAVLLDPFAYDLQVLDRFNQLLEVLDKTMDQEERRHFDETCIELRGSPYRTVDALVLSPSEDLGHMGIAHLLEHRRRFARQGLGGLVMALLGGRLARSGTDLASYLLFDGVFTAKLVALGRADVAARADEVRAFFARAIADA